MSGLSGGRGPALRRAPSDPTPTTTANNGTAEAPAESDEGRDPAKRNAEPTALSRTPGRNQHRSRGLHGVREAARKDSTLKFTALLHHINEDCLTEAFFNLKKSAAVGVDGVTWQDYEQDFLGFSYGFRPGRSQHDALDALSVAITSQKVNWILDADVAGFLDMAS